MSIFRRILLFVPLLYMLVMFHVAAQPGSQMDYTPRQVEAGEAHSCGIRFNGTLECWGAEENGQTNPPLGLGIVKWVSAGGKHTCAIKSDDTLSCWGYNYYNQTTPPISVQLVKVVSAGGNHTCAIRSDDTLSCWGYNRSGQTTLPADLGAVKAVSAGGNHTCAIRSDDTLSCWGYNGSGQTTLPADLEAVKAVSAGGNHTCAIRSDDTLVCWGSRYFGQTTLPTGLGTVKAVSAGGEHTCAIKSDDTLVCWGDYDYGQTKLPVGVETVESVSAGGKHTCAIKSNDTVNCWLVRLPKPAISLNSPSLTVVEGSSLIVKVNASKYGWDNIIVNFSYTGIATRTTDYNAASAALITTTDRTTDLVITTIDDAQTEVDETIILDIYSVTGGIENATQQITLLIKDNDSTNTATLEVPIDTPTSTPDFEEIQTNLFANSGFENGQTAWIVKRGVGDKIKCNKAGQPPVAKSGVCAFQFKGGVAEKSSVEQTLTGQMWAAGDVLNLSAFVKATNSATNGKIKVRVKYDDDTPTGKIDVDIVQNSDYIELTGNYTILSANVSKVKLSIQNKSIAGKVLMDDVQLIRDEKLSLISLP